MVLGGFGRGGLEGVEGLVGVGPELLDGSVPDVVLLFLDRELTLQFQVTVL